ncbi:ornithine cyclodeaminase [Duganella sp. CF458]|uniref:ornithine cyclodeaminase family protein n=1 Tax=Duganella sp. CF458 TaxID=1884368 RepID=UPI0008DFB785|nr:ornithine cyclodeaminase family protein [Duganella sp. CF458]SFG10154.1 ornithine cyclodeaminase [Duganella sp. CF458]
MRIINSKDVRALVTMADAVAALRDGYRASVAEPALVPARTIISPPGSHAYLGAMPAFGGTAGKFVVKVAALHLHDPAPATMHSLVTVQDGVTGQFQALIEGNSLTSLRTAATAALVTDLLAPADAGTVAIIGSGAQALSQLEAMCAVRPIRRAQIYSRNAANVQAFIQRCAALKSMQCELLAAPNLRNALEGAEIVCTATTSETPLIEADALAARCHINAVGNHTDESIEVGRSVLDHAFLAVEERAAAIREAGEFNRRALEIGELLTRSVPPAPAGHSVFVSVGTAFQDLCLATLIQQRAAQAQAGQLIEFA